MTNSMSLSVHPFCGHGRLADQCEDCAYVAALERGAPVAPRRENPPRPVPELAECDLYLAHGEAGRFTYVRAGDAIPAHLTQLARHPRAEPESAPEAEPDRSAEQSRGKVGLKGNAPKGNASPAGPELWTGEATLTPAPPGESAHRRADG